MAEEIISSTHIPEVKKEKTAFNDAVAKLKELAKKIDSSEPVEELKSQYQQIFDPLLAIAEEGKDVKLLARIQNIGTTLDRGSSLAGQEGRLVSEITKLVEILEIKQAEINGRKITAHTQVSRPEIKPGDGKRVTEVTATLSERLVADVLGSFSSLGEKAIDALKGVDLLDERNFLKATVAKLADALHISPDEAAKVKDRVNEDIKKRQEAEIVAKLRELEKINLLLLKESEKLVSENSALIGFNKQLQEKYGLLFSRHQEIEAEYKALKNTIATAQVEFNRLSLEISFLKDERARLVDLIDGKNDVLGKLLNRFEAIRTSYEFAKGEEVASKDLLAHLENLLDGAFKQKHSLEKKVVSTTEAFEKIHSEINDIIKKGKLYYYEKLNA